MNLSPVDQRKYPNLVKYIRNDLPKVQHIPIIASALRKNGEITQRSLGVVLTWGTQPLLKIVPMPKNQCGEFSPGIKSHEIRISESLVKEFESSGGTKDITLLLGATILHELAHWGDDQDGKDIPGEEGNMFETAAYGRVIPCVTK